MSHKIIQIQGTVFISHTTQCHTAYLIHSIIRFPRNRLNPQLTFFILVYLFSFPHFCLFLSSTFEINTKTYASRNSCQMP